MYNKLRNMLKEHIAFMIFILTTVILMFVGIIWVYHIKVLNAPKVYSDGFGYYVYLPAMLYQDFDFGFVEGWEHPLSLTQIEGHLINRYPVGTAIMESPFFFAAHFLSVFRDMLTGSVTATGYSNLYQYFILFGGVFYWVIGTVLLYRLLIHHFKFSKKISCITCVLITYGTNLFHYASYDACFSHIYSYTLFLAFLTYLCWYEKREDDKKNRIWHTCIFGILAGLIFMVRNTNILFVLTYVFYGVRDWESMKKRTTVILKPSRVLPIVSVGFITIMPQLAYCHLATGHWFVNSYGPTVSFNWLAPELINFLFSVRKGLFFWNPILLLSIIGMFLAYRKREKLYTGLVVFFLVIIYVSSAWFMWYYGGSFACRVAVDFMCVFAVFIAYVLSSIENLEKQQKADTALGKRVYAARIIVYGYSAIGVIWNCIMMLAYWYRIIPPDEATWENIRAVGRWLLHLQ